MTHDTSRSVTSCGSVTRDPLALVQDFASLIATEPSLSVLGQGILAAFSESLGVTAGALFLMLCDKDRLVEVVATGVPPSQPQPRAIPLTDALTERLRNQAEGGLVLLDLEHDEAPTLGDAPAELFPAVAIPLFDREARLMGLSLHGPVSHVSPRATTHPPVLNVLASQASAALSHALLQENLFRPHALMRCTDRLHTLEMLAGGFAHEVRNPLTSIKTFIQLAPERRSDPAFFRDFSSAVLDDVHRIERLVQDILDYARPVPTRQSEEDLNELLNSCLQFLSARAEFRHVRIDHEFQANLPPMLLDRQQIKQAVLNVLLNALEAIGERPGRVLVRTCFVKTARDTSWVQIHIDDTGRGIPAQLLPHLFDPFFTTKHTTGQREGTGLGLTMAQQIVTEHHGRIHVRSSEGAGTTVSVHLPMTQLPDLSQGVTGLK